MSRPFRPWRRSLVLSGLCGVVAVAALWQGFAVGTRDSLVVAAVFALVMAWGARRNMKRAGSRKFGLAMEHAALARLGPRLDSLGISWRKNVPLSGLGDADLVVNTRHGRIVVEIKSFGRWRQILVFAGARERAALAQAARAADALRARRAVVWLPQGRKSFLQGIFGAGGRGVRVVFGGEQALLDEIR